jgi:hypothetical protein
MMESPLEKSEQNRNSKDRILFAAKNFDISPADVSVHVSVKPEVEQSPIVVKAWEQFKIAANASGRQAFDGEIYRIFDDGVSYDKNKLVLEFGVGHYSDFRMFSTLLASHAGYSDERALTLAKLLPSDALEQTSGLYNPDLHPGICSVATLLVTYDGDLVLGKASKTASDPNLVHFIGGAFSRTERINGGLSDPENGDDIATELHRELKEELGIEDGYLASRFAGIIKSPNGENRILFVTYSNHTTQELITQLEKDSNGELSNLLIIPNENGNWNHQGLQQFGGCFSEMADIVKEWDTFDTFKQQVTVSNYPKSLGQTALN